MARAWRSDTSAWWQNAETGVSLQEAQTFRPQPGQVRLGEFGTIAGVVDPALRIEYVAHDFVWRPIRIDFLE